MIGQRIESVRSVEWVALASLILAGGLVALAITTGQLSWAIGAIFPALLAVLLLPTRDRPLAAEFRETGLEVEDPATTIPYADVEGVWAERKRGEVDRPGPRSYPIYLVHQGAILRIPRRLNVPSDLVYRFLFDRTPPSGSREVNPLLADYLRRQEETFGAEHVWSYRQRPALLMRRFWRPSHAFFLALMLAGIAWLVVGAALGDSSARDAWVGVGLTTTIFGALFYFLMLAQNRTLAPRIKHTHGAASLVISPLGIAMVQGEIHGELTWQELQDVQFAARASGFTYSRADVLAGIVLKVEGARIAIADVYDRPLPTIHSCLVRYWR